MLAALLLACGGSAPEKEAVTPPEVMTPGPADPGPPSAAPSAAAGDPVHDPPGIPALAGLPDPPSDLAGRLWGAPSAPPPGLSVDIEALGAVLRDSSDKRDAEKRQAAIRLGAARAVAALPDLQSALVRERSPRVKAAIASALGAIGDPRSIVPLWDALRDRSLDVRLAVIDALGRIEHAEAVTPLEALAKVSGTPESESALLALGAMRIRDASAALMRLEEHAASPVTAPPGRTVHVDATLGHDSGDGSLEAPFRTLGRGVLALRPGAGDQLWATAGDQHVPFREEVDVLPQSGGVPGRPTVLRAWPGRPAPVLDGELAGAPGEPGMAIGIHVGASWVTVQGFTARHYRESGIDLSGAAGNVLVDCTAERCERHGLFVYYSPGATVVNPTVRDCAAQGISVRSAPGTVVSGGITEDNGIDGLLLLQDSDDVVVDGLTSRGNARGIAFTTGSNRGRVLGVEVTDNRDGGVVIEDGSDAVVLP